MDQFTSILGNLAKSIGTSFKANPVQDVLGLSGLISQLSLANKEKSALDRSVWYSKHPEAIAQLESQFEKPLSTGLTKSVSNVVNANLAEQGLGQAPGIQSQVLAQALAPYQQNEQQLALTEALKAVGLPADALAAISGSKGDLSGLLKLLLPQPKPATPTPPLSGGTTPAPGITLPSGGGGSPQTDPNDPFGLGPPAP